MAEAAMNATDRIAGAAEDATTTIMRGLHRLWRVGLGVLVVAGEQLQSTLHTLETKGQELEPTVTAPFVRAGETASRVAERTGAQVRTMGHAVGNVAGNVAGWGSRVGIGDLTGRIERVVEEKLGTALERLDLPTRQDLRALGDRIDELAAKAKRPRESNG